MNNADLTRYSKRIVQYFWDRAPRNDEPTGICCLGRLYDSQPTFSPEPRDNAGSPQGSSRTETFQTSVNGEARRSSEEETLTYSKSQEAPNGDEDGGWPKAFLDDFESKIWLTYRSNFPPIPKSQDPKAASTMTLSVRLKSQFNQEGFTSDSGWGCMIRSGQCVLANTLAILQLGRDWRRGSKLTDERRLLSLFADDPKAPFSIHRFVEHGASACGKHPGEWFGPSATASCIEALCRAYEDAGINVYTTGDGPDIFEDKFLRTARSSGAFKPTLVLVGTRLGIDRVTPVYWEALKASLLMPQSVGIAGGRPSSSHYFVGTQGDYFFYLDPHTTRPFLPYHADPAEYRDEDIDSCHTRRLRRIHIKEMDPSMLLTFLIRDEADWEDFKKGVQEVQGKPVIHVADVEPAAYGKPRAEAIDEIETFDDDDDDDDNANEGLR